MFDNIKVLKTKIVKPRTKHQCVKCGGKIEPKQENVVFTTFSYDGRLISVYFCQRDCSGIAEVVDFETQKLINR